MSGIRYGAPCSVCMALPGEPCVNLNDPSSDKTTPHIDRRTASPCGTYGGYQQHVKHGEKPCGRCRQANADYARARRDSDPVIRRREADFARAQTRAAWALVELHRDEFRSLVAEFIEGGPR